MVSMIGSSETDLSSNHDRNELKVEKDTMGKKKLVNEFFLNFIYIVLWDVPNKISKF